MTKFILNPISAILFSSKVRLWLLRGLLVGLLASCGGDPKLEIGPGPGDGNNAQEMQEFRDSLQIGPQWSAEALSHELLNQENDYPLTKAALNTIYIRTLFAKGTGFFLGEYNGDLLVATNAHVLKNIPSCTVSPVILDFKFLNRSYSCSKVIGIWRSIDFALITIAAEGRARKYLQGIDPLKINFNAPIVKNNLLMTSGYGQQANARAILTIKRDDDCRVYSETEEFANLDNPVEKEASLVPSFAIGCDIAPGDSGSPVMDRKTGEVLGLVWSTYTPKPVIIRNQIYMQRLRDEANDDVWRYLSYAVPASKIKRELVSWTYRIQRSRIIAKRRATVMTLLGLPLD